MTELSLIEKREKWHAHVSAWEKSDLSQRAYCKAAGISPIQFGYWRKRSLRISGEQQLIPQNSFIPLKAKAAEYSNSPCIRIRHPNGLSIELPSELSTDKLCQLLSHIGSRHV